MSSSTLSVLSGIGLDPFEEMLVATAYLEGWPALHTFFKPDLHERCSRALHFLEKLPEFWARELCVSVMDECMESN